MVISYQAILFILLIQEITKCLWKKLNKYNIDFANKVYFKIENKQMKRVFFLIVTYLAFVNISCKESEKRIENIDRQDTITQTGTQNNIETTSLPFGYEAIYKNYQNKKLNTKELLEIENSSKLYDFYNSITTKNNSKSNYRFPIKNSFDFDLGFYKNSDSLKTDNTPYNISIRLPDLNKNKIYIANSTKNKIQNGYSLVNNIDLVIKDSNDKIINSLNISHIYYPEDRDNTFYLGTSKYFYIDKDYIIHLKYFRDNEDVEPTLIGYIKYKIMNNGDIIRYFDKETGHYKSEMEEGEIKNHIKDGIWKEHTGSMQNTYYMKKYNKGILIDDIEVIIEDNSGNKVSTFVNSNTYSTVKN